jgi:cation:H+ antiporter
MVIYILYLLGGLGLLTLGAEGLVRGSSALALRLGVAPLVIGLTVVSFGTGSPELIVSIEAASQGNSAIALGNVVGSNISNIALILGLAALARPLPVRVEFIRREVPVMIAVSLLLCVLLIDGSLSRFDGLLLITGSAVYTVLTYVLARRAAALEVSSAVQEEFAAALPDTKGPAWKDMTFVILGLIGLIAGAKLMLSGAIPLAKQWGLSEVVIGLTIIAIGTSLPELATSVVAALKNEADVALGNAIGSNILNILFILGLAALIQPISAQGLRPFDLIVMVGTAVATLPLLWRGAVLSRAEGALLLAGYTLYMWSLLSGTPAP